ncbi:MAG: hypothetical protein DRH08_04595 [Deltaproteobacteria bacterium]|nr:MAG: hypothetical protein DRH08_04595 [Deltaproteobacteria bacterium]
MIVPYTYMPFYHVSRKDHKYLSNGTEGFGHEYYDVYDNYDMGLGKEYDAVAGTGLGGKQL